MNELAGTLDTTVVALVTATVTVLPKLAGTVWSDSAGVCLVSASVIPNDVTAGGDLSVVTPCA